MSNLFAELVEKEILIAEIFDDLNPPSILSALVVTQLSTLATGGNNTEYSTVPAYQPSANSLVIADILNKSTSGLNESPQSVSGNGLVWELIDYVNLGTDGRLHRYRSMGPSPSSGQLAIEFSDDQTAIIVNVHQISGVNSGGVNGSGAIGLVSKSSGSDNTMSLALSPPVDGSSVAFSSLGNNLVSDEDFSPVGMFSLAPLAMNVDFDQGTQLTYTGLLDAGEFAGIMTEIIKA